MGKHRVVHVWRAPYWEETYCGRKGIRRTDVEYPFEMYRADCLVCLKGLAAYSRWRISVDQDNLAAATQRIEAREGGR